MKSTRSCSSSKSFLAYEKYSNISLNRFKLCTRLFILFSMVLVSSSVMAEVTYHAVICGVSDYYGTENDLTYCDDDAYDMRDALLAFPVWNSSNITLLTNSDATKSAVQNAIQTMAANADSDDVCVFYFSGHGTTGTDLSPYDESDGFDEYLVTHNFANIRDDELGQWIDALPTDKYAIFIDTCFSGGNIKSLNQDSKVKGIGSIQPAAGDGFASDLIDTVSTKDLNDNGHGVVLTACDDDELSWESSGLENGVFTYYLVEGITGLAADTNSNNWVAAEECYDYTNPKANAFNPDQHAQIYDAHSGELDFAGTAPVIPPTPQSTPMSQDFSGTRPGPDQGWEYWSSEPEGRIEVQNGALRMDRSPSGVYASNEAILHLDLQGQSDVILTFFQRESGDEIQNTSSPFTGHANGDGVSVSNDGIQWHQVVSASQMDVGTAGQIFTVDLDEAGIAYSSDFMIKFQQYDNSEWASDGREFDDINVFFGNNIAPVLSNALVSPQEGHVLDEYYWYVDYYDENGDSPDTAVLTIGDQSYDMTLYSGTASDGTYVYGPLNLPPGTHSYAFSFTDGWGGSTPLPETGVFTGPTVEDLISPASDLNSDYKVNLLDYCILSDNWSLCNTGNWGESYKLLAADGNADMRFGNSVSIDGDYAVIGAYFDDTNGAISGAAYIFKRDRTTWVQQAKLLASDGAASDYFGISVAISGDYAVIGANGDDDEGSSSGSAYIFKRDGTTWTQQAKLVASDGASSDYFGNCVSISGDYVVIGAYGNDDNGSTCGSAYIFKRDDITWPEQTKLLASDGAYNDRFGSSVSIDDDYAVIGAYGDNSSTGSAYIFKRDDITWQQQSKLTASDPAANDRFGISVSNDGDYVVVGASLDDDNGSSSGSAYIFNRDGITWQQQAKLTASDGASSDYFGHSVSIGSSYAIVGTYGDDDTGSYSGSAYIFKRDDTAWQEQAKLLASDAAASDYFGRCVSIEGNYAIISSYYNDDDGSNSGSAYTFTMETVADLDGDGCVGLSDLTIMADDWLYDATVQ